MPPSLHSRRAFSSVPISDLIAAISSGDSTQVLPHGSEYTKSLVTGSKTLLGRPSLRLLQEEWWVKVSGEAIRKVSGIEQTAESMPK
jgi:hypothetical protein